MGFHFEGQVSFIPYHLHCWVCLLSQNPNHNSEDHLKPGRCGSSVTVVSFVSCSMATLLDYIIPYYLHCRVCLLSQNSNHNTEDHLKPGHCDSSVTVVSFVSCSMATLLDYIILYHTIYTAGSVSCPRTPIIILKIT